MIMSSYTETFNNTVVWTYGEGFPLLMPRWGYVASAFVLFIIGFFGFFLNLMVIVLMFKDRQLWTPLNIILFNLVCSDFSVSVLGNPLTLISALFHRWVFGHRMCVLYGFFMALLGITSITTLTVISFERYLMVTRPLTSRHLSSKGATLSVVFIWTYSLMLTTPPLLGWGNYVNEAANISCSVNWHEQSVNTLTYILFLFAMGQIVPLAIITFSYVNIIRTMKRNSKRLGRVSRAEARATAMVFIMIISFTVAWTPYSVFALLEQFATEGIISPGAGVIPALVAKSSICYDPLIYVGMNTQFRQSIQRVFGIHSKRTSSHTDRGYNTTLSPGHKMSTYNEITVRFNTSEVNVTPLTQRAKLRTKGDEANEETKNKSASGNERNNRQTTKISDLCTIRENKLALESDNSSAVEHSEEEKSECTTAIRNVFGESCNLHRETSPVLTIVDYNRLVFSRAPNTANPNMSTNVYGNLAFYDNENETNQEHLGNKEIESRPVTEKPMRHSCSLELRGVSREKKRKFSIETKLDSVILPTNYIKGSVSNKLIDQSSKQSNDSINNYLCNRGITDSDDKT